MARTLFRPTTRDRVTGRRTAGVWLTVGHWAATSVHAFRRWTGETTLETWCELVVDVADGGALTADTITCLSCGQASHAAFWRGWT